jgi:hypothetical protein
MSLAEALESAVRSGDEERIRRLLLPLSEAERAQLQPTVRAIVATEVRQGIEAVARLGPMLLAAYGTLPASELRKLGWRSIHIPRGLEDVLQGRSAERLGPIVGLLLEVAGARAWYPVRALVRDGTMPRPEDPAYTVALLAATQYRRAADLVAEDPGLLDHEAWRLFEVEGGGEHSLAAHEKYTGDSWGDLFRDLAARDATMRVRLLDGSLSALARDFGAFRAGWFSRFHESLAPTDDERALRAAEYARLLRSRTRPTVSFAVAALTRISRASRLEPASILGSLEPVLGEAPVGTAKAALKLVGQAGADPGHAREAALVATAALAHPSAEVERAALKLIDDLVPKPDDALAQALAERLDEVAPSQRTAAEAALIRLGGGTRTAPAQAGAAAEDPAARRHGDVAATRRAETSAGPAEPPRPRDAALAPERALAPLETLDELIDTAVSVVETGAPAEDSERILEAVGRLVAERSDPFARTTAALARRCRTILERRDSTPFDGFDARADIAAVLWSWASGDAVAAASRRSADPGAGGFLSARAAEVAAWARGGETFHILALPTHAGGWIDPPVLVERLLARPPASRLDLVAAILRLAPRRRAEALRMAKDLDGEAGAAVRYALGGEERIGATAAWWVAAARARTPGEDDAPLERRHPGLGPDAGRAARFEIAEHISRRGISRLTLEVQPQPSGPPRVELPTVLMCRDAATSSWFGRSETAMLRWIATIQPAYREAWAALGSVVMARNVDWWSADWANRVYLEPFVGPLAPIGPHARRLIGIALGAKEAGERGLASDVVGLALADGRLSPEGLAGGLAAAAELGCDRPRRWALSLADVAAVSPAHSGAVAAAIGVTLPAIVDRRPTALVPLLRLLDELLAAPGSSPLTDGLATLRSLAERSGQTGRLARSILARS